MHVCAALALLFPVQDPALADEVRIDAVGFAIRPPEGWRTVRVDPPSLLKYQPPEGGLAGGDFLVVGIDPGEPRTSKSVGAGLLEWQMKKFEGTELVEQEDIRVGGAPALSLQLRWKEHLVWKVVVARSPVELYLLDFTWASSQEAAGRSLFRKAIDSARFWNVEPSREESAAIETSVAALKEAKLPPAVVGELLHLVTIADRPFGTWRVVVRKARVGDRDGYEFESVNELAGSDGGRKVDTVRGSFLLDGSRQQVDAERVVEATGRARETYRATVTIREGKCAISRSINGEPDDVSFPASPGLYIADVADLVRCVLAAKGKGTYALRRFDPFANSPGLETLEIAAPERMKARDGERNLIVALGRTDRRQNLVYRFEEDGRLESVKFPGVRSEIRRCTREEFEKKR